uniref:Uncharacterized protein n=1 Tax=Arundo donax TaxID=35708 RepID=A0A0A9EDL1_ARUDO
MYHWTSLKGYMIIGMTRGRKRECRSFDIFSLLCGRFTSNSYMIGRRRFTECRVHQMGTKKRNCPQNLHCLPSV